MEFQLDDIGPGIVSGWAYDALGHASLELLVNGLKVADTVADNYVDRLRTNGMGSGHAGFRFMVKAPGLSPGDNVAVRQRVTGTILGTHVVATFDQAAAAAGYDLLRHVEPFQSIFWRPILVDGGDSKVMLVGEMYVPETAGAPPELVVEGGVCPPATIHGNLAEMQARYWWLDGAAYHAAVVTQLLPERVTVRPGNQVALNGPDLNFGAVPSTSDMAAFKFAGAERARRVAGGDDTALRFAGGGLTAAMQLLAVVEASGMLPDHPRVLDWGCGAARVLQFVRLLRPTWNLHGADIDSVNIDWCVSELPDTAQFACLPLQPPSTYKDSEFDLIYGLSVITHLDEATRAAWLGELARIVRENGIVVLTYMSPFHLLQQGVSSWALPMFSELAKRGITDHVQDAALGQGLATYYRATYNTYDNLVSAVEPLVPGHCQLSA